MTYYGIIFICSFLFSLGIVKLAKPFFNLAKHTLSLLDALLEKEQEETLKHKTVTKKLGAELLSLARFILGCVAVLLISLLPLWLFSAITSSSINQLDYASIRFWAALVIGSSLPFVITSYRSRQQETDYNEWSKLLHRIVLDNYNISRKLHLIEKSSFSKRIKDKNEDFIIVTGLARAGTTAFTTQMYKAGPFHSLSYANMPFLLSPNLWKKVYDPSSNKLKERSHGDRVQFGYNTVEALEEYFFKNFLNDRYIHQNALETHEIDWNIYINYLEYQQLVKSSAHDDTTYLAKNNNFMLRYRSLRKFNPTFKVICMFRDPLEQAYSLLKQHRRFTDLQKEEPFVLAYMNWLGHHEFGLNQKYFAFSHTNFDGQQDKFDINYWMRIWINYYREVLKCKDDDHFYLLTYQDFLDEPKKLLTSLQDALEKTLNTGHVLPFTNTDKFDGEVDQKLQEEAQSVYQKLSDSSFRI